MTISFYILIFIVSIILHEMGHLQYFRGVLKRDVQTHFGFYKGKWRIFTGYEKDYNGIKKDDLKGLYLSGITLGVIPIIISIITMEFNIWIWFILALYAEGCIGDVRKIKKLGGIDLGIEDDK